jgi:transcriptional regulator with XRE-family HTH domain
MPYLSCRLVKIRGERTLQELAEASGVNRGDLSRIEHGRMLPAGKHLEPLERAYGKPVEDWYPPRVLAAIAFDDVDGEAAR